MSREVHVRFCENVGVQLPRATHCPLYRQSEIYARIVSGDELGRSEITGRVLGYTSGREEMLVQRLGGGLVRVPCDTGEEQRTESPFSALASVGRQ